MYNNDEIGDLEQQLQHLGLRGSQYYSALSTWSSALAWSSGLGSGSEVEAAILFSPFYVLHLPQSTCLCSTYLSLSLSSTRLGLLHSRSVGIPSDLCSHRCRWW
jgi:hypothetical protein